MNTDTPLPQVALHLPARMARLVDDQTQNVQTLVLIKVRELVTEIEKGVTMDPVTFDAVMCAIVPHLVAWAVGWEIVRTRLSAMHHLAALDLP